MVLNLLGHLRACGIEAWLVERPDRLRESQRTFRSVTCDALYRINDGSTVSTWGADVMSLASPDSHLIVPKGLEDRLRPLAETYGVVIYVEGESPAIADLRAVQAAVTEKLAVFPAEGLVEVLGLAIRWSRPAKDEKPDAFLVSLGLSAPSPLLMDQVSDTLRKPLRKKALVQAKRAKDAGCMAAVLLDWIGHAGIAQGSHWLPQHPETIRQAVCGALPQEEHSLDAVLLLDREVNWHLLWGQFPTF